MRTSFPESWFLIPSSYATVVSGLRSGFPTGSDERTLVRLSFAYTNCGRGNFEKCPYEKKSDWLSEIGCEMPSLGLSRALKRRPNSEKVSCRYCSRRPGLMMTEEEVSEATSSTYLPGIQ